MAVLVIRAHKRFGVCRSAELRGKDGVAVCGLLIELSQEGCRISNIGSEAFAFEELVEVRVDGWVPLCGHVRWRHDGMVGLRLSQALHQGELADLIHFCRTPPGMAAVRRA